MPRNSRVHPATGRFQPSPLKRHSKKTKQIVVLGGQQRRRQELLQTMQEIRAMEEASDDGDSSERQDGSDAEMGWESEDLDDPLGLEAVDPTDDDYIPQHNTENRRQASETPVDDYEDIFQGRLAQGDEVNSEQRQQVTATEVPRKTSMETLHNWQALIPTLHNPYLVFLDKSIAKIYNHSKKDVLQSLCTRSNCPATSLDIMCLYLNHFAELQVIGCSCETIPQLLVANGLFPCTPVAPRYAVSIPLLDFYRGLFERSCDAIHALSNALHTVYEKKGFRMVDKDGIPIKDPFRRSLGHAVQWFDALELHTKAKVDEAIHKSDQLLQSDHAAKVESPTPLKSTESPSTLDPCSLDDILQGKPAVSPPPSPGMFEAGTGECHRMLRDLCPACFGGSHFGRPLKEGGDIHVAIDGNFHHRHIAGAGEDIPFHRPMHFVSKSFIDRVGDRIQEARGKKPKKYVPVVPDIAVDACHESHNAAKGEHVISADDDEHVQKRKGLQFDDKGLMALVCRHDIPILFANIDTPGEQQKYAVGMLEVFFNLIPLNAVVVGLYDIACVLHRSLLKYDLLPDWITSRLQLATSAMHAYGHQWSCQLVYNPRLHLGLGLSDGEGVERLWSKLRKLIGVQRRSGRSRRIWLIDRQADAVARELRDGLGDWIVNRFSKGVGPQSDKAREQVRQAKVSLHILRQQWEDQKKTQLSLRAHSPAKLKKEVSKVLALHAQIEGLDASIRMARKAITEAHVTRTSLKLLIDLKETQDLLKRQAEGLYASLNIEEEFPALKGVDAQHLIIFLLARDLKINIRKRAIGSFLEWYRLDQSVGGKAEAIGTKAHQDTRKTIAKRKPALMNALRLFNSYVEDLEKQRDKCPSIPIPLRLPLDLKSLQESVDLFQDVWITPCEGEIPMWLQNVDVRAGIHGMLKLDRCSEERIRLGIEADNLCRWFSRELTAVELARRRPERNPDEPLLLLLEERRNELIHLQGRWRAVPAARTRLIAAVDSAAATAMRYAGNPSSPNAKWIIAAGPDEDIDDVIEGIEGRVQHDTAKVDSDEEEPPQSDDDDSEVEGELTTVHGAGFTIPPLPTLKTVWTLPTPLRIDTLLFTQLKAASATIAVHHDLTAPRHMAGSLIDLDRRDLVGLVDNRPITSGCLNSLMLLFQVISSSPAAKRTAIFTSFVFMYALQRDDDALWRNSKDTRFWEKDVWIFPIHRLEQFHWVLAILLPASHSILVFDSFGGQPRAWKHQMKELNTVAYRMTMLASKAKGETINPKPKVWTLSPLSTSRIQFNGHDCGLWVLAVAAAWLRGCHVPSLTEEEMPEFRHACLRLTHDLALK
ncbi:hypothetical protein C8J56DRAFT_1063775 [Mycena floridula]|nr:hypothetical protein C8J56DRAFT_1063775 [Mycena floridula]